LNTRQSDEPGAFRGFPHWTWRPILAYKRPFGSAPPSAPVETSPENERLHSAVTPDANREHADQACCGYSSGPGVQAQSDDERDLLNFQLKQFPLTGHFCASRIPIAFHDRLAQPLEGQGRANDRARAMDGKIFNSRGVYVGRVLGSSILDLRGLRIYDLKGINIYKLSGELVGHLPADVRSSERRLDKSADKLFR
jgi:hypothetical protein